MPDSPTRPELPDNVWRPMTQHRPLRGGGVPRFIRGEGCVLFDSEGNEYVDALAGVLCVNVGYGRPELSEVAARQLTDLAYVSPVYPSVPTVDLAAKIETLLGERGHVYFSVSGSEANEAAFKIARQFHLQNGEPTKYKIISRYRAYHGTTFGALAATGQAERKIGYDPGAAGFLHVQPPYPYRSAGSATPEEHAEQVAGQLEDVILHEGAQTVAAFIMEPIISGGGVIVPPDNYIPSVRDICSRYGVLLIFDEVVSGFGRTGAMFGFQHWSQQADIYTFAKGIASAYMPLAATFVKEEIFRAFDGDKDDLTHFRHINTYGGHPAAAAVALENIRIVESEGLVQRAGEVGDYLQSQLQEQLADISEVGEIRGRGLLIGVELVSDRNSREPLANSEVNAVLQACRNRGVIVGRNGNTIPGHGNVLLLAPPLIITRQECDTVIRAIKASLSNTS